MSYQELLSDAEWFCDQAESTGLGSQTQTRLSTASILFSFISVESFINSMMFDFSVLPSDMFTPHEQGLLSEKTVELCEKGNAAGRFEVTSRPRYQSLESKIMFLVARFSTDNVDKGSNLWQRFEKAKDIRDRLTHPRKDSTPAPLPEDAQVALEVAKDIIQLVSQKVWGTKVQF